MWGLAGVMVGWGWAAVAPVRGRGRGTRTSSSFLATIALVFLSSLAVIVGAAAAAADEPEYLFNSSEYDDFSLGRFVRKTYHSYQKTSPLFNILYWHPDCDDGRKFMLTVRGGNVPDHGPMILDTNGTLVWFSERREPYELEVQRYKGKDYLTFWVGDDGVKGHGSGTYYMLNEAYEEVYHVSALNGVDGDLHDFQITLDQTILMTIYHIVPGDLSSIGGPDDGWIWEGMFQEIDLETNTLLFEWRASEHFDPSETYRDRGSGGTTPDNAFDFFHINSVEKDPWGNYLISSRYMHVVAYIDGRTGEVLWKLGGKKNNFTDLSDGQATNFAWQHHARWRDNYTAISLFDNESQGSASPEAPSRGLILAVDQTAMTAQVKRTYMSPSGIIANSQGSMQLLDDDRVLLGYGAVPAMIEYRADGTPLCEWHFGPAADFGSSHVLSYRAFKYDWVGKPKYPPSIAQDPNDQTSLFVSWNGATEVAFWAVQAADTAAAVQKGLWAFERVVPKTGFETAVGLDDELTRFYRLAAVDRNAQVLGYTAVVKIEGKKLPAPTPTADATPAGATDGSGASLDPGSGSSSQSGSDDNGYVEPTEEQIKQELEKVTGASQLPNGQLIHDQAVASAARARQRRYSIPKAWLALIVPAVMLASIGLWEAGRQLLRRYRPSSSRRQRFHRLQPTGAAADGRSGGGPDDDYIDPVLFGEDDLEIEDEEEQAFLMTGLHGAAGVGAGAGEFAAETKKVGGGDWGR